jgi:hypothetical protein
VLPTARGREIVAEFEAVQNLSIVYGDLTDYGDVERCVCGADFILHTGALVSPAADDHPELTMRINVEALVEPVRPSDLSLRRATGGSPLGLPLRLCCGRFT